MLLLVNLNPTQISSEVKKNKNLQSKFHLVIKTMPCFLTVGPYDSIATVAISAVPQCQQGGLWQIVQKDRYNGFLACVNVT